MTGVGERVAYAVAGRAMRQAQVRAAANPELSKGHWQVLGAVLSLTVGYSRLSDRVSQGQVAKLAGTSSKTAQRALKRLSACGVIVFDPGRGAGVLSLVGVPPEGEKADTYLSSLLAERVGRTTTSKVDKAGPEKVDTHARARNKDFREDKSSEEERTARRPPSRRTADHTARDKRALQRLVDALRDKDDHTYRTLAKAYLGKLNAEHFDYVTEIVESCETGSGDPIEHDARFAYGALSVIAGGYDGKAPPAPTLSASSPSVDGENAARARPS